MIPTLNLMPFDWNSLPPPQDIVRPEYPTDSPARREDESTEAFNYDAACAAFGQGHINYLMTQQSGFRGDWWMLAMLLYCISIADDSDPENKNPHRLIKWSNMKYGFAAISVVHIHLERANLSETNFAYIDLSDTLLYHANLHEATLEHAMLRHAYLCHANVVNANLNHATATGADLNQANLTFANLDHANLRGAKGILFNDNAVKRMDIEGNAPDPWSVLRRTYTGPKFFVNLLLVVGFLLPYAAKVLALTTASRAAEALRATLVASGNSLPWADEARAWLARFDAAHIDMPAWWVLLGGSKVLWWLFVPTAVAVLFYNALRGYLTLNVGILRDQADRVQRTPTLTEYYGPCHHFAEEGFGWSRIIPVWCNHICTWWRVPVDLVGIGSRKWRWDNLRLLSPLPVIGLYRLHCIAYVLFWISLISVGFHIVSWVFTTTVPVPR